MANTLKFGNGEWYGKKDTILAYNDENRNYKPLPFDFSRASSATVINKDGLIEEVGSGQPRIDYKDDSKGALLLEPQSTNLVTYSEDFSNVSWAKNGALTVTSNASTSPSSETNATLLYSTSSENRISQNVSVVNGNTYTLSAYLKNNGGNNTINFEVIGYSSKSITITNEWARYDFTITATSTSTVQFRFLSFDSNVNLYIYGAQVEEGSYATSYIPTQGSAVTRLAETCSQTVPDGVVGQTEGTLYADVNFVGVTEAITNQIFFLREQGSNNGYLFAGFYQGKLNCGMRVGGSLLFDTFFSSALTKGRYKIAIAYKSGDTKIYVNGVQTGFKNNSFGVTNFAEILLTGSAGTNQLGDINREFKLYNTRLTDQELQALTQV